MTGDTLIRARTRARSSLRAKGLPEIVGGTLVQRPDLGPGVRQAREDQDCLIGPVMQQPLEKRHPVETRHDEVEDHQPIGFGKGHLVAVRTDVGGLDLDTLRAQSPRHETEDARFVVDHQDAIPGHGHPILPPRQSFDIVATTRGCRAESELPPYSWSGCATAADMTVLSSTPSGAAPSLTARPTIEPRQCQGSAPQAGVRGR